MDKVLIKVPGIAKIKILSAALSDRFARFDIAKIIHSVRILALSGDRRDPVCDPERS